MSAPAALTGILVLLLVGCGGRSQGTTAKEPPNPEHQPAVQRDVTLFFESAEGVLQPESRRIAVSPQEAEAIGTLVGALISGPQNAALAGPFPEGVELRAAFFLPDGTAIVDLAGSPFSDGWQTGAHAEWLAIQSVARTLTGNLPKVRQVRFLVNGQPVSTLGGHILTSRAIRPVESRIPTGRSATEQAASP